MLQSIRDRAHSWVAIVIIILFCIPFALYGINQYFSEGGKAIAAIVFDREISDRELSDAVQFKIRQIREQDPQAKVDDSKVREEALEELVKQEVLLHQAVTSGYRAADSQIVSTIRQMSGLEGEDGTFDDALYTRLLSNRRMSVGEHYEQVRRLLVAGQYSTSFRDSGFLTERELREYLRLSQQKRDVHYVVIAAQDFVEAIAVSDEEIAAHYQENLEYFSIPEKLKIEYIELDARQLGQGMEPSVAEIEEAYEAQREGLTVVAQRKVRHILIALDANADAKAAEEAKARAEAIRTSVLQGEDFAAAAKTHSEDLGSANAGGDLGFVERGAGMEASFEEAAFTVAQGEVSPVVRSTSGFHLIWVDEIREAHTQALAEVRTKLIEDLRLQEGERLYYDSESDLIDRSYASPESLDATVAALDIEAQQSDWFSREEGEGIAASAEIRLAAFSEQVYKQSYNSDPIELAPAHTVVLRVLARKASKAKPLAEVREEIALLLRNNKAKEQAREKGQALFRLLVAQGELAKIAEKEGITLESRTGLNRMQRDLDAAIVEQAFRLPKSSDPAYGHAITDEGDFVVMAVSNVQEGVLEKKDEGQRDFYKTGLGRLSSNLELETMIEDLRRQAEVTVLGKGS